MCVDGLNHRMLLRKMRNKLHQDIREGGQSTVLMLNQVKNREIRLADDAKQTL